MDDVKVFDLLWGGRTVYFGPRWDAPRVDDAVQVDTPVGEPCARCREPIIAGERGIISPYVSDVDTGGLIAFHAECDMLGVIGHQYGICQCHGPFPSVRYAARALWSLLEEQRGRSFDDITA